MAPAGAREAGRDLARPCHNPAGPPDLTALCSGPVTRPAGQDGDKPDGGCVTSSGASLKIMNMFFKEKINYCKQLSTK